MCMKAGSGFSGTTEARARTEAQGMVPRTRQSWGAEGCRGSLRPWKKRGEPSTGCSWLLLGAEVRNESQGRKLWVGMSAFKESIGQGEKTPGRASGTEERETHQPTGAVGHPMARLSNT